MDSVSQTKDVSIVIYTDFADEGLEAFRVVIVSSSDGTSVAEPAEATVIINDSGMLVYSNGYIRMSHLELVDEYRNVFTLLSCSFYKPIIVLQHFVILQTIPTSVYHS